MREPDEPVEAFDVTPEWLIDETASGRPEPRRARRVKLAWFDYVMFALTVLSAAACLILRELLYGDAFSSFDIWDVYSVLQRIYQAAVLPAMWFSMGWSAAALLSYLGVRSLTLGKFARPAMIVLGAMLPITFAVTVLDVLVLELWYPYHTLWLIGTPSALAPGGLLLGLAVKRKEKTKMKKTKKIVSAILALAVLASMSMPSFAAYGSGSIASELQSFVGNSVGVLTCEGEEVALRPSNTDILQLSESRYAASAYYDVELRAGEGEISETGTDVSAGATMYLITIYFETMSVSNYKYVRLNKVSVSIDWSDDQIVLSEVTCSYKQDGFVRPGHGYTYEETGSHSFPISGHYYSCNTEFTEICIARSGILSVLCQSKYRLFSRDLKPVGF